MIEATLIALTALSAVILLLQHWQHPAWWVRGWDFPRLQIAIVMVLVLIAELILLPFTSAWHFVLTAITLVCLVAQLWWILPYTRLWPYEVKAAARDPRKPRIRVMAANVLTPNRQAERLLELVRLHRPDVLVALETDRWWESHLDHLTEQYPYSIRCPQDNLYGMHVYSRLPLEEVQTRFLVEDDVPSMHARLRVNDQLGVRMHFLHPRPPSPTENDESTERDVELLVVAKSTEDDADQPIIVAGDLNDVAWSPTTRLFRKISCLLDPRVGRGMFNTFHAQHWFLRWPLDHFFHSRHFQVVEIVRLPEFGSDHFPVLIELQYEHNETDEQQGLQADPDEQRDVRNRLASEGVKPADVPEPSPQPKA
ncbi:endonuclease/exonuclease/phosphatase family protein [Stutzerimonas tarimensis]|uniref:Endonuclease/exonuclease/phosphatase family protein n=1 Tax=Stutzerimonas tarimensis TaxID=1507735 RepID=A0ABV7SZY8_9GAMM